MGGNLWYGGALDDVADDERWVSGQHVGGRDGRSAIAQQHSV